MDYVASEPCDNRLLKEKGSLDGDAVAEARETGQGDNMEIDGEESGLARIAASEQRRGPPQLEQGEPMEIDAEPCILPKTCADATQIRALVELSAKTVNRRPGENRAAKRQIEGSRCISQLLIVAAHVQKMCITQQVNMIYGNPGTLVDCGRCSSCIPDQVPEARPSVSKPTAAAVSSENHELVVREGDKTPRYLRLTRNDIKNVASELRVEAIRIRSVPPIHPDALMLRASCFLSDDEIDAITRDFHLVTSFDVLKVRLMSWRYWDTSGAALWDAVEKISHKMHEELTERHCLANARKRATAQEKRDVVRREKEIEEEERVHEYLVAHGLGLVKKIKLVVLPPEPAISEVSNSGGPVLPNQRMNLKRKAQDELRVEDNSQHASSFERQTRKKSVVTMAARSEKENQWPLL
ncbi:hypothetical protein EW146_g10187 [Bondarzewia mesenterica]|uniref:Uncharacterized protein n=1 Tax=Bondarzewia mesenterica TaxID=1095465 RepID=A0A4S4L0Y2_9AGAM|nr:hypothetical protein EW146_g10187 [Bondarzewia mesenterica]